MAGPDICYMEVENQFNQLSIECQSISQPPMTMGKESSNRLFGGICKIARHDASSIR